MHEILRMTEKNLTFPAQFLWIGIIIAQCLTISFFYRSIQDMVILWILITVLMILDVANAWKDIFTMSKRCINVPKRDKTEGLLSAATSSNSDGREYYENNITKSTQLERLRQIDISDDGQQEKDLPPAWTNDALPTGWTLKYTKDGRKYYQNNSTKTTQWNHPGLHKDNDQ